MNTICRYCGTTFTTRNRSLYCCNEHRNEDQACRRRNQAREYRKTNPQAVKQSKKKWDIENPDKKENPEKHRLRSKIYRQINKEKSRMYNILRRVRISNNTAPDTLLTYDEWRDIVVSYGGRCVYCGEEGRTMDHVIPLKFGGQHSKGNVVPACQRCNNKKRTDSVLLFLYKSNFGDIKITSKIHRRS